MSFHGSVYVNMKIWNVDFHIKKMSKISLSYQKLSKFPFSIPTFPKFQFSDLNSKFWIFLFWFENGGFLMNFIVILVRVYWKWYFHVTDSQLLFLSTTGIDISNLDVWGFQIKWWQCRYTTVWSCTEKTTSNTRPMHTPTMLSDCLQ